MLSRLECYTGAARSPVRLPAMSCCQSEMRAKSADSRLLGMSSTATNFSATKFHFGQHLESPGQLRFFNRFSDLKHPINNTTERKLSGWVILSYLRPVGSTGFVSG